MKSEVLELAIFDGQTLEEAEAFCNSVEGDETGIITYEIYSNLKRVLNAQELDPKIPFEMSTVPERVYAMVFLSKLPTGSYYAIKGSGVEVEEHYGRHFSGFTPNHVYFYPMVVIFSITTVLVLHFLNGYGVPQAVVMLCVDSYGFFEVVKNAPYILLGQVDKLITSLSPH